MVKQLALIIAITLAGLSIASCNDPNRPEWCSDWWGSNPCN